MKLDWKLWAAEDGGAGGEAVGVETVGGEAAPANSTVDEAAVAADAAAAPATKPAKPDWRDLRLAKLTGQLKETREQLAKVTTTAGNSSTTVPPATPPALTEADIDAKAAALVAQQQFNERCAQVAKTGHEVFGQDKFQGRVEAILQTFDRADPQQMGAYHRLLEAAMDTGKGHEILYALGGNQNEAARLMELSPVKLGLEVAKLAAAAEQPLTGAPKPISPVGTRGATPTAIAPDDKDSADKLSTEAWMKARQMQIDARRGASR